MITVRGGNDIVRPEALFVVIASIGLVISMVRPSSCIDILTSEGMRLAGPLGVGAALEVNYCGALTPFSTGDVRGEAVMQGLPPTGMKSSICCSFARRWPRSCWMRRLG